MSLPQRLWIFLAALGVLVVSDVSLDIWGSARQRESVAALGRAVERQLLAVEIGSELEERRKQVAVLEGLRLASADRTIDPGKLDDMIRRLERFGSRLAELESSYDPGDRASAAVSALRESFALELDAWREDPAAQGQRFATWVRDAAGRLRAIELEQQESVRRASANIIDVSDFVARVSMVVLLVTLAAGVATGVWFARYLYGALRRLGEGAAAIGAGELDQRIDVGPNDAIGVLAKAFNQMAENLAAAQSVVEDARQRAEHANQAKSQFLANMSHELRTPMNAIIGYSEMLIEDLEGDENEDARADLSKIRTAGHHLLELINDVLDLSKIEAGKMTILRETFRLPGFVEEIRTTALPLAAKTDTTLEVEVASGLDLLYADQTKLRQILLNLLSNACKFTRGGRVRLEVASVSRDRKPCIEFRVTDTGIGMTQEQLDRIFDEFAQAEADTAKQYGGTGLGLPISRRLCNLMGGDIEAESRPGEGTKMTAWLPALTPPQTTATHRDATVHIAGKAAPGSLILVIDDDPAVLELTKRFLGREGFEVATAASGAEGIALAKELAPAVITLDLIMPEMDGWTVLAALKESDETCDIPVILVTMLDERERGLALGASEFITKPVDREALIRLIGRLHRGSGRVLIVDDEPALRELMRRVLEAERWDVVEAENGRVALERIDECEALPDVVLLDLMMPEMDGFAFLRAFRELPGGRHVPVAVITAKDLSPEERARLQGFVATVIQKDGTSRETLLGEIVSLVRGCVEPQ